MIISVTRKNNLPNFLDWLLYQTEYEIFGVNATTQEPQYSITLSNSDGNEVDLTFNVTQSSDRIEIEIVDDDPHEYDGFWNTVIKEYCTWVESFCPDLPEVCEFVLIFTQSVPIRN